MNTPLTRLCARHVLWRKHQAGNIYIYIYIYIHTHRETYICIYIHRQKLMGKKISSKFQTTLPHIYRQKIPKAQTHRGKITVSELQNHFNAHTQQKKHIKYQWGVKQTKANTL